MPRRVCPSSPATATSSHRRRAHSLGPAATGRGPLCMSSNRAPCPWHGSCVHPTSTSGALSCPYGSMAVLSPWSPFSCPCSCPGGAAGRPTWASGAPWSRSPARARYGAVEPCCRRGTLASVDVGRVGPVEPRSDATALLLPVLLPRWRSTAVLLPGGSAPGLPVGAVPRPVLPRWSRWSRGAVLDRSATARAPAPWPPRSGRSCPVEPCSTSTPVLLPDRFSPVRVVYLHQPSVACPITTSSHTKHMHTTTTAHAIDGQFLAIFRCWRFSRRFFSLAIFIRRFFDLLD